MPNLASKRPSYLRSKGIPHDLLDKRGYRPGTPDKEPANGDGNYKHRGNGLVRHYQPYDEADYAEREDVEGIAGYSTLSIDGE